jgi:hypothetical protein
MKRNSENIIAPTKHPIPQIILGHENAHHEKALCLQTAGFHGNTHANTMKTP